MSVCAHRPESVGMFTPCALALGGCLCAAEVEANPSKENADHGA